MANLRRRCLCHSVPATVCARVCACAQVLSAPARYTVAASLCVAARHCALLHVAAHHCALLRRGLWAVLRVAVAAVVKAGCYCCVLVVAVAFVVADVVQVVVVAAVVVVVVVVAVVVCARVAV